mmetsp:Transcript_33079/g.107007  ORF Transcript_33079/g.107007 Transcript_33079/m.107007 type:complete len:234 (-) Transcript_33079:829-1530(-)
MDRARVMQRVGGQVQLDQLKRRKARPPAICRRRTASCRCPARFGSARSAAAGRSAPACGGWPWLECACELAPALVANVVGGQNQLGKRQRRPQRLRGLARRLSDGGRALISNLVPGHPQRHEARTGSEHRTQGARSVEPDPVPAQLQRGQPRRRWRGCKRHGCGRDAARRAGTAARRWARLWTGAAAVGDCLLPFVIRQSRRWRIRREGHRHPGGGGQGLPEGGSSDVAELIR